VRPRKLYSSDVTAIRRLWRRGASQTTLAARFGVTQQRISQIVRGSRRERGSDGELRFDESEGYVTGVDRLLEQGDLPSPLTEETHETYALVMELAEAVDAGAHADKPLVQKQLAFLCRELTMHLAEGDDVGSNGLAEIRAKLARRVLAEHSPGAARSD